MDRCDLAVVGGSFAGLACARQAALNGLDTRVFERKIAPGAYTQSTGIFVQEIADMVALPAELMRRIKGVRLYAPNMQYIDLRSPGYSFVATDTQRVLTWMADRAVEAGANIESSTQVQEVTRRESEVILEEQELAASYLVAADGANSAMAKQLGLGTNQQVLCGAEYEVDGFDELDADFLHVFINSDYAPGYIGWLFKGVKTVQLGVAVKPGKHVKLRPFFEFLKSYFGSDATMLSGRGGLIPCGGVVSPWADGNVCLVGDAAGMVSPLTAGGIHPSIEIGEQLGVAVAAHLRHGLALPQDQIRSMVKRYPVKKRLRSAYNQFGAPDSLVNFMISNGLFRRVAQIVFFHHRGLLSKDAWRDILFAELAAK
ncbi:NAD(P)/FAD-dependent oxidoreductase [Arenicella xantha]|uniref:Protein CbrA n=1 Tax=Arenicella xantha TaxID=644221 RepID=A0A395JI06_9GAMM|nr:NAD(P)/FAD-dependent oxidoreductase [Arenicella xantha]RBP48534.1 flavin-dependent dehydrogenase [Arenicella xantha]